MSDERVDADAPQGNTHLGMTLRVEVFPDDLDEFVRFYTEVLGFALTADRRDSDAPYVAVERGSVRIGALRADQPIERSARTLPTGVEIVLEVDDLAAAHDQVRAAGYPIEQDLTRRPWGLTDFRLYDPAGYYLRITDRE